MAKKSKVVACPAAVAVGAAMDVSDMVSATLSIVGAFTATYQVQVSYDNVNFVNQGAALTTAGTLAIPDGARQVLINCTAYTSGTPAAGIGGVFSAP